MSGKLDVKRIAAAAGGRSSAMPDKHISLDLQLPHGKTITLQVPHIAHDRTLLQRLPSPAAALPLPPTAHSSFSLFSLVSAVAVPS